MWTAYTAHAAATFLPLARRPSLPLPALAARLTGSVMTAAGAALLVAGMQRFAGVGELTGTTAQPLLTGGIYPYSRNPQYLGYIVMLAGRAMTRRSAPALSSAAVLTVAYAAWVPMEEHLIRTLGEPYTAYRQRTHRWWGNEYSPDPGFRLCSRIPTTVTVSRRARSGMTAPNGRRIRLEASPNGLGRFHRLQFKS